MGSLFGVRQSFVLLLVLCALVSHQDLTSVSSSVYGPEDGSLLASLDHLSLVLLRLNCTHIFLSKDSTPCDMCVLLRRVASLDLEADLLNDAHSKPQDRANSVFLLSYVLWSKIQRHLPTTLTPVQHHHLISPPPPTAMNEKTHLDVLFSLICARDVASPSHRFTFLDAIVLLQDRAHLMDSFQALLAAFRRSNSPPIQTGRHSSPIEESSSSPLLNEAFLTVALHRVLLLADHTNDPTLYAAANVARAPLVLRHDEHNQPIKHNLAEPSPAAPLPFNWRGCLASLGFSVVIALLGFFGFILSPLNKDGRLYRFILEILLALSLGTLVGDSLFHLIPHSLMLHIHEDESLNVSHNHTLQDAVANRLHSPPSHEDHLFLAYHLLAPGSYVWKFCALIAGILTFYLIDVLAHILPWGHHECDMHSSRSKSGPPPSHHRRRQQQQHGSSISTQPQHSLITSTNTCIQMSKGVLASCTVEGTVCHDAMNVQGINDYRIHNHSPNIGPVTTTTSFAPVICAEHKTHEHASQCHSHTELFEAKNNDHLGPAILDVPPSHADHQCRKEHDHVSMLLILSDVGHHIFDGIALGAAFMAPWPHGLHNGISTSIAIACHEIPHKLGDVAVLVQNGHNLIKAILMVSLASLVSVIGVLVGMGLASSARAAALWIDAFTAGMFFYIALAMLIPKMTASFKDDNFILPRIATAFAHILGTSVGLVIMFLIAVFEDRLHT